MAVDRLSPLDASFLHIENDVLLYIAPREYESWLRKTYGDGVAVCPLTAHEDTAAVMLATAARTPVARS